MKKTTLYIGLNDKDTKAQEISTEHAKTYVFCTLPKYVDGATVTTAEGLYTHENGTTVIENTIKIEILEFDENTHENILEFARLAKSYFNQESVAIQTLEVESVLY